jgi:Holin of 3TMs, for gene-transfer release
MPVPALAMVPMFGDLAKGILDRVWPKEMTDEEKAVAEAQIQAVIFEQTKELLRADVEDLSNARMAESTALTSAGPFVNGARAMVTVTGGYMALGVVAWNKIAPSFGYSVVTLTEWDYYLLGGILSFFFAKRYFEKKGGFSAVR